MAFQRLFQQIVGAIHGNITSTTMGVVSPKTVAAMRDMYAQFAHVLKGAADEVLTTRVLQHSDLVLRTRILQIIQAITANGVTEPELEASAATTTTAVEQVTSTPSLSEEAVTKFFDTRPKTVLASVCTGTTP